MPYIYIYIYIFSKCFSFYSLFYLNFWLTLTCIKQLAEGELTRFRVSRRLLAFRKQADAFRLLRPAERTRMQFTSRDCLIMLHCLHMARSCNMHATRVSLHSAVINVILLPLAVPPCLVCHIYLRRAPTDATTHVELQGMGGGEGGLGHRTPATNWRDRFAGQFREISPWDVSHSPSLCFCEEHEIGSAHLRQTRLRNRNLELLRKPP